MRNLKRKQFKMLLTSKFMDVKIIEDNSNATGLNNFSGIIDRRKIKKIKKVEEEPVEKLINEKF
jgi:hypothetical protein